MAHQYVLVVEFEGKPRRIRVDEERIRFGRGVECDVVLADPSLSRVHGTFRVRDGELLVEDCDSRNGIFVNDECLFIEQVLNEGDRVRMASAEVRVEVERLDREPGAGERIPAKYDWIRREAERIGFELTELMAASGMGLLFEARDLKTKARRGSSESRVAFKILKPERNNPVNVERMSRESRTLLEIRHPNVLRPLLAGSLPTGEPVLVTEYIVGRTASQLRQQGRLRIPEVLAVAAGTLSALDAVHQKGISHRDVKPSNVMVEDGSHRVVLIDFGLALGVRTRGHGPAGTLAYCAPEQVRPKDPEDAARAPVDIYGFGTMLFTLLTGEQPFPGERTIEVHRSKLRGLERGPRDIVPDVPPVLDRMVRRCVAPEPADRPSSARSLAREVHDLACGYPRPTFGFGRG